MFYLLRHVDVQWGGGKSILHPEASCVLIYIVSLDVFIAPFLLVSNFELLEDLDVLVLYAYILKSLG